MRAAVVGAGIAGLAVVWHLLQRNCDVTVFEQGEAASSASTGLLHPFPGREALRSWRADEGMEAAKGLLQIASSERPVFEASGLLRFAVTEKQKTEFKEQSSVYTERDSKIGRWQGGALNLSQAKPAPSTLNLKSLATEALPCGVHPDLKFSGCPTQPEPIFESRAVYLPKAAPMPVLWIPEGITVYSRLYLEGLWKACARAKRVSGAVSLHDLDAFDAIVLAAGAGMLQFPECRHLLLKKTIGQSLICRWPEKFPFALLALGHIVPTEDPAFCQVGSTYEHTANPDPQKALQLLDKCAHFYPPAKDFQIVEIRSGVRISPTVGYKPLAAKIAPKTWVFTGLGSRGLLYHALLAKELVEEIHSGLYDRPL